MQGHGSLTGSSRSLSPTEQQLGSLWSVQAGRQAVGFPWDLQDILTCGTAACRDQGERESNVDFTATSATRALWIEVQAQWLRGDWCHQGVHPCCDFEHGLSSAGGRDGALQQSSVEHDLSAQCGTGVVLKSQRAALSVWPTAPVAGACGLQPGGADAPSAPLFQKG